MPDQSRLLVPRRSGDGQRPAEQRRIALADRTRAGDDAGQGFARDVEQGAQVVAPFDRLQIHQRRAGSIGRIGGVDPTAGQFPDQPGVDRAQLDLALRRPLARPGHSIQEPGELGRREVGIEDQAGGGLDYRLVALGGQAGGDVGGAAILPDDGAMQRLAGRRVPDHGRFALIGDADGVEAGDAAGLAHHLSTGLERRGPDFGGVMFDPAGFGEMLGQFDLADRDGPQVPFFFAYRASRCLRRDLEGDGAGRGRALVDGEDQAHGYLPAASWAKGSI